MPSEAEQHSLAGSTASLLRNEYRYSNRSLQKRPISDTDSLHLTNISQRPTSAVPVDTTSARNDAAPIISLPYEVSRRTDRTEDKC